MSAAGSATHAIKDPWFLSFLPALTAQEVEKDHGGDWNLAKQRLLQQLDYIRTVEELWSTVNSLPKMHQLGKGNMFIFARNNKDASYEAFPDGGRIFIDTHNPSTTEKALEVIFASVMGEEVAAQACKGKSVCDVLRMSGRPSYFHRDLVRTELWLNDATYSTNVVEYLKQRFLESGINPNFFAIEEAPFTKEKESEPTAARSGEFGKRSDGLSEGSHSGHTGSSAAGSGVAKVRNSDAERGGNRSTAGQQSARGATAARVANGAVEPEVGGGRSGNGVSNRTAAEEGANVLIPSERK